MLRDFLISKRRKPVIIPNDDLIRVQKEREIEGIRIPKLIWDEILLGAATVGLGKEETSNCW